MRLRSLDQVEICDLDSYIRSHTPLDRPVVFLGAARAWPAMTALSLGELKKAFGHVAIPVRESDNEFAEFFGTSHEDDRPRKMMKLDIYIDTILRPASDEVRPPYAGNISILGDPAVAHRLRQLVSSCHFPNWFSEYSKDEYRLWIAAPGQRSTIHNDPYHNFNAQIVGRKYFILFAPEEHKRLCPRFFHVGMWVSPIDLKQPDFDKFPDFVSLQGFEHELNEGDILYLPRFWWHCAEAMTPCVNVNRWIFSRGAEGAWWHQQPAARSVIPFDKLLTQLCSQFSALPADLQELRRREFDELRAEFDQLARHQ